MRRFLSWRRRTARTGVRSANARPSLEALEDRTLLSVNPIVAENQFPGTPQSTWDIQYSGSAAGDPAIQGFATDISVNHGQAVSFKINDTQSAPYHIDIYRMGYYQGDGARLVATLSSSQTTAKVQPAPLFDSTTGLTDCGNWSVTASWSVPSTAVSGIYFAHVIRDDTGGDSHILFVVRDDNDANPSGLLFQTSDSTWQAYNDYGGSSLYVTNTQDAGRAYKVSYNRPLNTRADQAWSSPFNAEYPMVRWLEANGYNVSYSTDVDSDRNGAQILQHKVFLSVGHDEYWSAGQRGNVESARAHGVNLAFFSGNEVFWKTRWENSTDSSNTPYRTLVCYKETSIEQKIDPTTTWTGTWRDPSYSPPADGDNPENALTGTIFMVNGDRNDAFTVPAADAPLRFWRNTAIASLPAGSSYTMPAGTLGYEWDEAPDNGFAPAGLVDLSSTTLGVNTYLLDYGWTYGTQTATHNMVLYRDPVSKALVFGAGTVQYSWGLDSHHDRNDQGSVTDVNMQQAAVNLFADMGVQPGSLQAGLISATASTDTTAPTSAITTALNGTTFLTGAPLTINGAATDSGGGVVGGVEVSVDGGNSWHPAVLSSVAASTTWSFVWTPAVAGTFPVQTRAVDDSGNLEVPAAGTNLTVLQEGFTLWAPAAKPGTVTTDGSSVEVGVKFTADTAGSVTGIRFYKGGLQNFLPHTVHLWTGSGQLLASATAVGESVNGWQQVNFASPVTISANATYVASYFAPVGEYADDQNFFTSAGVDSGLLHAPVSSGSAPNGVYAYGSNGTFPNQSYLGSNYWVDVALTTAGTTDPRIYSVGPANGAGQVTPSTRVTVTFNKAMDATTLTPSTILLKDSAGNVVPATVTYDAGTFTAFLTPSSALNAVTWYTVTVAGGGAAVKDTAGHALANSYTASFFTSGPAPAVSAVSPVAGATGVSNAVAVTVTFSHGMDPATLTASTLLLTDPSGNPVPASVGYDAATFTATLTPRNFLALSTRYTVTVVGGKNGVKDPNSRPLAANYTWSFTTAAQTAVATTIWRPSAVPQVPATADPGAVEVGVQFYSTLAGYVTGVRFYKGAGNTGTHLGNLWDTAGDLLATATFSNETAGGWQQVSFASPVQISANTTYVVSYFAPNGYHAADAGYFTAAGVDANPLHAPDSADAGGNGVYAYGSSSSFPNQSGGDTNYWVDVVFQLAPLIVATNPASGAGQVSTTAPLTVTFSEAMNPPTITTTTVFLKAPAGNVVAASVSYNAATFTATLTPSSALAVDSYYTAYVLGGSAGVKDQYGNALPGTNSWSFLTDGPAPVVNATSPAAGATQVGTTATVAVTFSHAMDPTTLTGSTLVLTDPSGNVISATIDYNAASYTATLTPNGFFATATTYTLTVVSGSSGVQDLNGRSLAADSTASFTTTAQPSFYPSLWRPNDVPQNIAADTSSIEVGVQFYSDVSGYVTGVRFYKDASDTGTHLGNLWTTGGQLLASATFSNETTSGWQQVHFSSPVQISASTAYVVSYFAPNGGYAADAGYFTGASWDAYPLHAPDSADAGGNGVYAYGSSSSFPNQSSGDTNYWVDVVFSSSPAVSAVSPAGGATGVGTHAAITITFDRAMDATTLSSSTVVLKDASGNVITAVISYNPSTFTLVLTPSAPLNPNTTYTVTLLGGSSGPRVKDQYGNYLSGNDSWSFTTGNS